MKTFLLLSTAILGMASLPFKPAAPVEPLKAKTPRELVLARAVAEHGVTEKTGRNDGPVEKYLEATGLNPKGRDPYCACFVYWSGLALDKNPYPKSAWSPDMVSGGVRVTETNTIKGAEAFGIYFASKKRVAHTGLVIRRSGQFLETIEGNTSPDAVPGSAADRDGQGVFKKKRHWRTVYSVKDWIK